MQTTTRLAGRAIRGEAPDARAHCEELFERVMGRIHRYFRRRLHRQEDVEDAMQQTVLLLHKSLREGVYDPDRSFNTWMWLKARTVWAQHWRRQERAHELHEDIDAEVDAAAPDARLCARDLIRRMAARLSEEELDIFLLRYEGDLTQAEISEITGRDRKTVRARLRAAERAARALSSADQA